MSVKNEIAKNTLPKWIKIVIEIFFFLSYANVALILKKKTRKNVLLKWFYMFCPFLVLAINLTNMMDGNVFWRADDKYTYLLDMSNSVGLTLLFFISYFISGVYTDLFKATIRVSTSSTELKKHILKCGELKYIKNKVLVFILVRLVLFGIGILTGGAFLFNAGKNGLFWIQELYKNHICGLIFYSVYLGTTWYHSLCLIGLVLSGSLTIYGIIKNDLIEYKKSLYNNNPSIVKLYDMLIFNFSYGIFYIGGSIIFIINDYISAANYNANSTFADPKNATILLLVILALVLVAYLPIHELKIFMDNKKVEKIEELRQLLLVEKLKSSERERLQKNLKEIIVSSSILTTFRNKITFAISLVTPIIGIVVQILTS